MIHYIVVSLGVVLAVALAGWANCYDQKHHQPKPHCIDGYLYYYSEKDKLYISRTSPPKSCVKELGK